MTNLPPRFSRRERPTPDELSKLARELVRELVQGDPDMAGKLRDRIEHNGRRKRGENA